MSLLTVAGAACIVITLHSLVSLGLTRAIFRRPGIAPAPRQWMLVAALVLPSAMGVRFLAESIPAEARVREAFRQMALPGAGPDHLSALPSLAELLPDEQVRYAERVVIVDEVSLGGPSAALQNAPSPDFQNAAHAEPRTVMIVQANEELGPHGLGAAGLTDLTMLEVGDGRWERMRREVSLLPGRAAWMQWGLPLLGLIWLSGLLLQIGRAFRSGWAVRRLLAGSRIAGPELAAEVRTLACSAGLEGVEARVVDGLPSPFATWGQRLLLPDWVESIPRARRQAILAHELAHLAARDPLLQLLMLPFEAALWMNPLRRWSSRAMREAVEHRCDDAAIESTDRMTFARALADVATRLHAANQDRVVGQLAVSGAPISDRVARALQGERGGRAWMAMVGGALLVLLTAALPPLDPGPEYHLKVVQSAEVIEHFSAEHAAAPPSLQPVFSIPAVPRSES